MLLARRATLNVVFGVTNFYLSCSILIVNRPCSVANTKCKPNSICHSLEYDLGIGDLYVTIIVTNKVIFRANFNRP